MEEYENMKQRLVVYVRDIEKMSNRSFERKAGLSDGFLSRPGSISVESLVKIARVCPGLSLRWLLLGDGDMIARNGNVNIVNGGENTHINNVNGTVFGGFDNSVVHIETVCDEVQVLKVLVRDLRQEKEAEMKINHDLHKENQMLLELLSKSAK